MSNKKQTAVEWYKSLSINQKINLKEMTILICGLDWQTFNCLFTPLERIQIIYNKLKIEEII